MSSPHEAAPGALVRRGFQFGRRHAAGDGAVSARAGLSGALGLSRRLEPLAIAVNLLPRALQASRLYPRRRPRRRLRRQGSRRCTPRRSRAGPTELSESASLPAIAIGSSNGALVHVYAALGIPWLPQTVLDPGTPGRRGPRPAAGGMEFGANHAARTAGSESRVAAPPHARSESGPADAARHDLLQGQAAGVSARPIERFITQRLRSGGTIILADCRLRWPTTRSASVTFSSSAASVVSPQRSILSAASGSPPTSSVRNPRFSQWQPPSPGGDRPEVGIEDRGGPRAGYRARGPRARLSHSPPQLR